MLSIDVDALAAKAKMDKLAEAVSNLHAPMAAIGAGLVANIQLGIREGLTPWGDSFAPLKNLRSSNRDARKSDIPLNDTRAHIYDKINYKAGTDSVEVGMFDDAPIGEVHQFGSKKNNIPARPFLPIDEQGNVNLPADWGLEIEGILLDHFKSL